jgi:pentatricopeptide repeat protein
MNGLCKKGLWREATAVLQTMTDRGVQPDVHACMIVGLCKR